MDVFYFIITIKRLFKNIKLQTISSMKSIVQPIVLHFIVINANEASISKLEEDYSIRWKYNIKWYSNYETEHPKLIDSISDSFA